MNGLSLVVALAKFGPGTQGVVRCLGISLLANAVLVCALQAQPIPVSVFAQRPAIADPRISSDGRYVLFSTERNGNEAVAIIDRRAGSGPAIVLDADDGSAVLWCRWLSAARFACALRRSDARRSPYHPFDETRLVAVNADATDVRGVFAFGALQDVMQYQIAGAGSNGTHTLLVESRSSGGLPIYNHDNNPRPEILRLDTDTGDSQLVVRASDAMPRFIDFVSDPDGTVIIARGLEGRMRTYWTRMGKHATWRELSRFNALQEAPTPTPFSIIPGTRHLYALGKGTRHIALWRIDPARAAQDTLLYESPVADILEPVFDGSGLLLGLKLDALEHNVQYLNPRDRSVVAGVDRLLPDRVNEIEDVTSDRQVYVLRSSSDVHAGSYYLLDVSEGGAGDLQFIGSANRGLDSVALPRLRAVALELDDGTPIRAMLAAPGNAEPQKAPLVVMPDDGPAGRAEWRFSPLRHFLLSRGYAVLQVQLEETSAARDYAALRRDLPGRAYAALERSARWAVSQGIADPQRVAVMGWGFGGYLALLGSQRDPELFTRAIAINAVTDLRAQLGTHEMYATIGTKAPPPLRSILRKDERSSSPILIIHGSDDSVVHPHAAVYLARALALRQAPHERLQIEQGTHEMSDPDARARLLEAIERFLASAADAES